MNMNCNPYQMNYNQMAMNINPMQMNMQMQMILQMQNKMQKNNFLNNNIPEEDYDDEKKTMWIFNKCNVDEMEKFLSKITDKRKKINYVDTKNNRITKHFPIYFTKSELYTYIDILNRQETILFYKNDILDNDESSIQDIEDNSTITLFSKPTKNYLNSSLYKYIDNFYPNCKKDKSNVSISSPSGCLYNFVFPNDIKIFLMIKFISLVLDLDSDSDFLINGKKMNKYDNRKILELSQNGIMPVIKIVDYKHLVHLLGNR